MWSILRRSVMTNSLKLSASILALAAALCLAPRLSGADAPKPIKPGNFAVASVHSFALFKVQHFNAGYTYGQFKEVNGKFVVDADPTKGSIEVTIKTDSVDTKDAKRDKHL